MALVRALGEVEAEPGGVGQLEPLEATAVARLREERRKLGGLPIECDCRKEILAIGDHELVEVLLPLCTWLKGLTDGLIGEDGGRILVGLCGSAAAGKSTLAQLLCAACGVLWGTSSVTCLSMDAYSFPNAYLSAEPAEYLGRPCALKDIKGRPETLDAASFLRDLDCLRLRSTHTIMLPAYSRDLHDPVPNCVAVAPDCRIVIVEGLHLLHHEGCWEAISMALHRTIFLDISRSKCFDRVVGRKVANGRSRESSEAHFERVDGPIWDQLQEEKARANLILTLPLFNQATSENPLVARAKKNV